jgi:anti-sigma factor RsiW
MKCPVESRETSETLLAYCSRTLDPEAAALLERHMARCPACAEFAAGQKAVWDALDAWDSQPASLDFDRRLYARIGERVSLWEWLARPFRPAFARQGLPIAAAACLLVMVGIMLERPGDVPLPASSQTVEAVPPDQVETALDDMEMLRQLQAMTRSESAQPGRM